MRCRILYPSLICDAFVGVNTRIQFKIDPYWILYFSFCQQLHKMNVNVTYCTGSVRNANIVPNDSVLASKSDAISSRTIQPVNRLSHRQSHTNCEHLLNQVIF